MKLINTSFTQTAQIPMTFKLPNYDSPDFAPAQNKDGDLDSE